MSLSSVSSLSKRKDKQEKQVARAERESAGLQQVKKKLKAKFEHLDEAQLSETARELTTKEDIKILFSHLYIQHYI